eukprot:5852917-Alexandrium_andersonii.AAC.1
MGGKGELAVSAIAVNLSDPALWGEHCRALAVEVSGCVSIGSTRVAFLIVWEGWAPARRHGGQSSGSALGRVSRFRTWAQMW